MARKAKSILPGGDRVAPIERRARATMIGVLLWLGFGVLPARSSVKQDHPAIEYVSPLPGSDLMSQQSNIIIRTRDRLARTQTLNPSLLSIVGATSGEHSCRAVLSDDERTLVFVPSEAFAPGETVTVKLQPGLHSIDGEEVEPIEFSFRVSSLSSSDQARLLSTVITPSVAKALPLPSRMVQSPKLPSKALLGSLSSSVPNPVIVTSDQPTPGSLFLATWKADVSSVNIQYVKSDQQYLMILDNTGNPRFYRQVDDLTADFKLQPNGHLSYLNNDAQGFIELDSSYSVVNSCSCGNGYLTDLHELLLLPNGHALLMGKDPEIVDMSKVVPSRFRSATVLGMVIQELDTNKNVVFQWRSFDHFDITDATHENMQASTIDYVHPNALELDSDGNILLSSRHMDEITKIDRQTGNIIWRFGGKNNQFTFINDPIGFSHQHCIRRTSAGTLLMFDNGNYHTPQFSRAVEYSMNEQAMTATLVWQFRHTPDVYALAMASVQRLSNGNTLIGWGSASPALTEVRVDGSTASLASPGFTRGSP